MISQTEMEQKKSQVQESRAAEKNHLNEQMFHDFVVMTSPNYAEYDEKFVKNKKSLNLAKFSEKLNFYGVHILSDTSQPIPIQIQQGFKSNNRRIIQYIVRMSFFIVRIKIFNTVQEDNYSFDFSNQISEGNFGTVYEMQNPFNKKQIVAIKQIKYKNPSIEVIQNAVKQYAMIKILAALQIGPPLIRVFGFDIVITSQHIMFSTERGLSVHSWIEENARLKQVEKQLSKLEDSLLTLHVLRICHNDIKPANIIYSPTLQKLVFIDFGFSDVRPQPFGYMSLTMAKGSLYYCSDQMKNVFLTTGQGFFDTYYNDYICLKKTKQAVYNFYQGNQLLMNSNFGEVYQDIFDRDSKKSPSGASLKCISSLVTIYTASLIQSNNIKEFCSFINEKSFLFSFVEQNLKKICLFFLQVEPCFIIWKILVHFLDIFPSQSPFVSSDIKKLIEKTLKPYYQSILQNNVEPITSQNKFQVKDDNFLFKMYKRYDHRFLNYYIDSQEATVADGQKYFDLEQEDFNKFHLILNKIKVLSYQKQRKVTELLLSVTRNKVKYSLIGSETIFIFKKCLSILEIDVTYKNAPNDQNHIKFIKYLSFFCRLILMYNQTMSIQNIFSWSVKKVDGSKRFMLHFEANYSPGNQICQNQFEILQIYVMISERIIGIFEKALPYEKCCQFIKRYISCFETKIQECFEIKNKSKKEGTYNLLEPLLQALLKKYLIFRYQICLTGYLMAYNQMNLTDLFSFHKCYLSNQIQNKSVIPINQIQKVLGYNSSIKFSQEFVNLMSLLVVVPISLIGKFSLIQRFQSLVNRLSSYIVMYQTQYLKRIIITSKLKLFILYVNVNCLVKSLKIAQQLIDSNLITQEYNCIQVLQILFKRLNNSKGKKLVQTKFLTSHTIPFQKSEQNFAIQNELQMLDNFQRSFPSINSTDCLNKRLKNLWEKCINSTSYKNKFSLKLYLQRNILSKIISNALSLDPFISDYQEELQKYKAFTEEMFYKLQQIVVDVEMIKDLVQQQKKILFKSRTLMNEFMLQERQAFAQFIMMSHPNISQKQLINRVWNKYIEFYQSINTEISQAAHQSHLQIVCSYHEHIYRIFYFAQKQSNPINFNSFSYQNNSTIFLDPNLPPDFQTAQLNFKNSTLDYLVSFNKNLLDHDFYLHILIALKKKNICLEDYDSLKINILAKEYFYFMSAKQQIYVFFYSAFGKYFLDQLIEISIKDLFLEFYPSIYFATTNSSSITLKNTKTQLLSFVNQSHSLNQSNSFVDTIQDVSIDNNYSDKKIESIFCINVLISLWNFTKISQCLSYSHFLYQYALKIKRHLALNLKSLRDIRVKSNKQKIIQVIDFLTVNFIKQSHKQANDSFILVFLLKVLKIDFQLKIQLNQLLLLLKYINGLKYACKDTGIKIIYAISFYYWLNNDSEKKIKEECNQKTNKTRKIKYYLTKLLRVYSDNNMFDENQKYLEFLIGRLKDMMGLQSVKRMNAKLMMKKVKFLIRCNFQDENFNC